MRTGIGKDTVALIDHGAGNLRSVGKALQAAGGRVVRSTVPAEILAADRVVLPGVGAFADVMGALENKGLDEVVRQVIRQGTPLLGICVGMQVLFETGAENGVHAGLGILPGTVRRFPDSDPALKIPHTGWNTITVQGEPALLQRLPGDAYAYFNHSYFCTPSNPAVAAATTLYGTEFVSVVEHGRVFGVQFHPEKSQAVGLKILENFMEVE